MDIVAELYESNHLIVLTIVIVVILIIIIKKNQQIKNLNKRVEELNSIINEYRSIIYELETVRIENISKAIKVGSLVRMKYVLSGELITILVSENQSGKLNNQSEIMKVNAKMPLAVALLNKQVGNIVKFKKDISDEQEIYVEVLEVNNGFKFENKNKNLESDNLEKEDDFETQGIEVEPINILETMEAKNVEIDRTRFYVDQKIYDELVKFPNYGLKINVVPNNGNHPKGYYLMSNNIAIEFIKTKQGHPNWDTYENFHQDSVPVALRNYFTHL